MWSRAGVCCRFRARTVTDRDVSSSSLVWPVGLVLPRLGDSMRRHVSAVTSLLLSNLVFAHACPALAQAGSTGGVIGKQEKSISGGVEADRPPAAPRSKRPAANSREASSGAACSRIVGTWKWGGGLGLTQMVFSQNGTVRQSLTGSSGSWSCAGTMVKTAFTNGSTDRITLSRDGNSAAVVTTWGGGHSFPGNAAERQHGPVTIPVAAVRR